MRVPKIALVQYGRQCFDSLFPVHLHFFEFSTPKFLFLHCILKNTRIVYVYVNMGGWVGVSSVYVYMCICAFSVHVYMCIYVYVCVCVYVYVLCVGMWVCGYVGMWVCGYVGMWVCGACCILYTCACMRACVCMSCACKIKNFVCLGITYHLLMRSTRTSMPSFSTRKFFRLQDCPFSLFFALPQCAVLSRSPLHVRVHP